MALEPNSGGLTPTAGETLDSPCTLHACVCMCVQVRCKLCASEYSTMMTGGMTQAYLNSLAWCLHGLHSLSE